MDPNGFAGVNGIFRFNADGTSERGLAVLEVQPDGFHVVSPAPKTFQPAEAILNSAKRAITAFSTRRPCGVAASTSPSLAQQALFDQRRDLFRRRTRSFQRAS